jgi:hypothetical protein
MHTPSVPSPLSIATHNLSIDLSAYQKAMGNNKVEAISLGAEANHRIAFARAVPQWKKWFDEMLVTPSKSTSK